MGWYPITTLAAAIINIVLAAVVYWRGQSKRANILFGNILIVISIWCWGAFMVNIARTADSGLLWNRLLHIGAILAPPFFIHFAWEFSKTKKSQRMYAPIFSYLVSAYFLASVFDPEFIINVVEAPYIGYAIETGPKYTWFNIYYGIAAIYGLYLLYSTYKKSEGYKYQQAKYFLLSMFIAILASVLFFLLSMSNMEIAPIDNFLVIIFSITFSYAMLTYRLVDVKIAISKIFIFAAYFIAIITIYTAVSALTIWLFVHDIFSQSIYAPLIAVTVPFSIFIIAFPPLRDGIMQYVDSIVYGRDYNYRQLIKETSHALVSILDLRELLGYLTDTISQNLKPQRLYLFLKENRYFNVRACSGVISSSLKLPEDNPLVDYLEENKQALLSWEFESKHANEKKIISTLHRLHAQAIVPLYVKERLSGFLSLDIKKSGKSYSPQDLEILNAVATNAAIALENAHLYEEAITDGLTGLYHHKYFQTRIREELDRAINYRYPLSLLMIDIDHFKRINDNYGHQVGDQVLVDIAEIMKKNLRLFDITARYGGEEFAILLPAMGQDSITQHYHKAISIAERLRKEVKKHKFAQLEKPVTISLGVAFFDGKSNDISPRALINEADEQLYNAKKKGRDLVCKIDVSKKLDILSRVV